MSPTHIKMLLEKLNEYCIDTLESAAAFAGTRGHYDITIEHMVLKFLEKGDCDFDLLLRHFKVNLDQFWQELLDQLSGLRSDNQHKPSLSLQLVQWLERAWTISSLRNGDEQMRSGVLLEALLEKAPRLPGKGWQLLNGISSEEIIRSYPELNRLSQEGGGPAAATVSTAPGAGNKAAEQSPAPNLDAYTSDFTARARGGDIDPVLGRNDEIRQMIDILTRRRKNNPIMVGEPGVGKTAVVEGLALRIVEGNVPDCLKDIRLICLDLGLLQAGAGVKGEFEKRLKAVIDEIRNSAVPIILFIDEAHTLIGAGGDAGQGDAANLLKPTLARGELRTLAATTWCEYKKYFERDAALDRRFQMVKVDEPSLETAKLMLGGLKERYQKHHQVLITEAAVEAAVELSSRYISGRFLPDKAIDLLDTAAARVGMGQAATPAAVDTIREQLEFVERRLKHLQSEQDQGLAVEDKVIARLKDQQRQILAAKVDLELRWQSEVRLVEKLKQLRSSGAAPHQREQVLAQLEALQEKAPLVQPEVSAETVAQVVADWTGIPLGRMVKNELSNLLDFEEKLSERIIGQYPSLSAVGQTLRSSKSGLGEGGGPVGVFMLTGPSGVGKTETARAIGDMLFGGERFMVTINMSEYQEAHSVSQLKGSPPGYVGYGEGGILTEAVRQRPYCVILLDEVEKAHPDVLNMFYQVFDRGLMRDGEGREIDFKNTVIIMTSNLGADELLDLFSAAESAEEAEEKIPDYVTMYNTVMPALQQHFPAALLARIQVVPMAPLQQDSLRTIIMKRLDQVAECLNAAHAIEMSCQPEVVEHLIFRCQRPETGARMIHTLIEQQLLPGISRSLLQFMADDDMPQLIRLELNDQGELSCIFSDLIADETAAENRVAAVACL